MNSEQILTNDYQPESKQHLNQASQNKIWTLIDILQWTSDYFKREKIDSPRLNAELLLCHTLSMQRIDLYTNFDRPLNQSETEKFKSLIRRRIAREPLQYILGSVSFCGIDLDVNLNVLIPRPETEILFNIASGILPNKNENYKILDIGTGSGCLAVAMAKEFPYSEITATDISADAIAIAQKNANKHKLENIIFKQHDILDCHNGLDKYDLILSNPPYISIEEYAKLEPGILNFEPKNALTDNFDGLNFFRRFAELFPKLMKTEKSFFYFEIGFDQSHRIKEIFSERGINVDFKKDFSGIERICYHNKE